MYVLNERLRTEIREAGRGYTPEIKNAIKVRLVGFKEARPKNVVLFPVIGWMKNFSSLTRPHSRICIRTYIFLFQIKKLHKQKAKETNENRKTKEAKEEKEKENVVIVNNICGKSNEIQ